MGPSFTCRGGGGIPHTCIHESEDADTSLLMYGGWEKNTTVVPLNFTGRSGDLVNNELQNYWHFCFRLDYIVSLAGPLSPLAHGSFTRLLHVSQNNRLARKTMVAIC